jgi:hypothetical protein
LRSAAEVKLSSKLSKILVATSSSEVDIDDGKVNCRHNLAGFDVTIGLDWPSGCFTHSGGYK